MSRRRTKSKSSFLYATRYAARALFDQRGLIFRPSRTELGTPEDVGLDFETHYVAVESSGRSRVWWIPSAVNRTTVILFPGRGGNISYELSAIEYLHNLGVSTLAVDYPGFGGSEGRPSEAGCYAAANAAWRLALEWPDMTASRVVLYGRSLGAAVATWLAAREKACRGLVFHGGFSSLPDVAACHLPRSLVRALCRTSLDSQRWIGKCRCPVLMMHSQDDTLVPVGLARRCFDLIASPKRLIELRGDHDQADWLSDEAVRLGWQDIISDVARRWPSKHQESAGQRAEARP
jgi:pimeloyl-ACP methyl ester carboxylesterase